MANQQFDEGILLTNNAFFGAAGGTAISNISPSGYPKVRIDSLFAANYDSIDHTILVGLTDTVNIYPFAAVALPAAVGGVPSVKEVMSTAFTAPQACLLPEGALLAARMVEAPTDDATPVLLTWFGGTV